MPVGLEDSTHPTRPEASESRRGQPGAVLGHRRLSIIDLGTGQQPLSNEDETVWIAFNGEIYNYRELRPDLEARGHRFRTHSDTETIVHLYEEYGPDCVAHLAACSPSPSGTTGKKRLFLARDRIGKKPLFYRLERRPAALRQRAQGPAAISRRAASSIPAAVDLYLTYQYVPHPHCIFEGYNKLAPRTLGPV